MRGNKLLDKMELVDPAYVAAADAAPETRKKRRTLWQAAPAGGDSLDLLPGKALISKKGAQFPNTCRVAPSVIRHKGKKRRLIIQFA